VPPVFTLDGTRYHQPLKRVLRLHAACQLSAQDWCSSGASIPHSRQVVLMNW
jgi:hypothetical protein